jgi:TonB family protein
VLATSLTQAPRGAAERAARWGSLSAALVLHAALLALLVFVLAPRDAGPPRGDTSWFDLALVGPSGGGGEEGGQDAGRTRAEEPSPPADPPPVETPPTEQLTVPEVDLTAAPIDSTPALSSGELVASAGAGIGPGLGDGSGGEGGGSGGGSGGGIGPGSGPGMGGGGPAPQPLHLVVPQLPRGVDVRSARGKSVALLVQVRPDGSVSDARVDRSSGIPALDRAALVAALRMRYRSAPYDTLSHWARTEIRF